MVQGLVTALRTLTVVPVPGEDSSRVSSSLPWFPVVGVLLGACLAGAAWAIEALSHGWHSGAALVALLSGMVLTGGLHFDGLADWADGFGGSRDRSRTLEIMKDSNVGAFGVLAVVGVVLLQWAALTRLLAGGGLVWIPAGLVVSRSIIVDLTVRLPYARAESGTAAPFVQDARPEHLAVSLVVALLMLTVLLGPLGVPLLLGAWILVRLMGSWFLRRVGGVTGDLLGATVELVTAGVWLTGACLLEGA